MSRMSLLEAAYALRDRLPRSYWVSTDKVRRLETGEIPEEKADPILVAALADVYDVDVADLSPAIAGSLEQLRRLLPSAPGDGDGARAGDLPTSR